MNGENPSLESFHELVKPWEVSFNEPEPNRLDVVIHTGDLVQAVRTIIDAKWGYLSSITGLDHPGTTVNLPAVTEKQWSRVDTPVDHSHGAKPEGYLEALYQFVDGPQIGTLRVRVPYHSPELPSLYDVIPSVTLYERELIEMLGFYMPSSPDQTHLILPEEWPTGVFPLRKEFQGLHLRPDGTQV